MITGEHTFIRGAEHDDVPALAELYRCATPRAGLLDARREPIMPSREELRDLLGRKEIADGTFYTVEDRAGRILGFCSLRGLNPEARHGEFSLLFLDPATYDTPAADEVAAFLFERAFVRWGLHKVMAYTLEHEAEFSTFLRRQKFALAGRQREILYAGGRWHDMETYSRDNSPLNPA